jgi:hypothetical protein
MIEEPRFKCMFPKENCPNKTGRFNRQYNFKKHLLHAHFVLWDCVEEHDTMMKLLSGVF